MLLKEKTVRPRRALRKEIRKKVPKKKSQQRKARKKVLRKLRAPLFLYKLRSLLLMLEVMNLLEMRLLPPRVIRLPLRKKKLLLLSKKHLYQPRHKLFTIKLWRTANA
jgi:hypothetical protein